MKKSFVPPLLMLAAWLGVLAWWTSGFSVFTTFSHTLRVAGPLPRAAPVFQIRDQFGAVHETSEFRGRYVLLQFAYLSCGDACALTLADFYRIHEALSDGMPANVMLLTVSFDPRRDSTERRFDTWRHYGRPASWTFAALTLPLDDRSRSDMRRLGVFVSRRDDGLFNHSAQAFLIDPQGQVVQVFVGPGNGDTMIAALKDRLS